MDLIRIHIDELVIDGFKRGAPELPERVAAQVAAALADRGLPPTTATHVSTVVGTQVARSVPS